MTNIWLLRYMINVMILIFPVNFPFLRSNIPESPAYGVYISQLIRYSRACSDYLDFLTRGRLLTSKLLQQGYQSCNLRIAFNKFYGRHHELIDKYQWPYQTWLLSLLCRYICWSILDLTLYRFWLSQRAGETCWKRNAHSFREHLIPPLLCNHKSGPCCHFQPIMSN